MTIRIMTPLDWAAIKPGHGLQLNGDKTRVLKIELNCEAPTRVDLVHHDGDGVEHRTFLGIIQGLDKIEVVADADAMLDFTTDGEVWYFTNDGAADATLIPDEVSFTKLLGRRTRNDQIEIMLRLQQEGYNRLLAQQEAERLDLEEQLERARANEIGTGTTEGAEGEKQPEPAPATAGDTEGEDGFSLNDGAPAVPA